MFITDREHKTLENRRLIVLTADGRHQHEAEQRDAGKIAPVQRHRHRVAARLAERRGENLDDPEALGDLRDFAQCNFRIVIHG